MNDEKSLDLLTLIPIEKIQRIQDDFCRALGISARIVDLENNPLTKVSSRHTFCDDFVDTYSKFNALCQINDKEAIEKVLETGKPYIFRCHAGFYVFSIPITVQGKIIACIQGGRVRLRNPDLKLSEQKAKYFGVPTEEFLKAYWELTYFSEEKLEAVVELLKAIANIISKLALEKVSEKKRADKIEYFKDILEKEVKKRTKELVLSQERYKALVEHASDIIYILDPNGILLSINKSVEDIAGYKQREVVGRKFSEFLYEEDIPKVTESFLAIKNKEKDKTLGLKFRIKTKKGDIVYLELNSRGFYDKNGNFTHIEGFLRDITEKVKLERRLLQTTERYKAIFNSIKNGAYIADMKGTLLSVNLALLEMFGCAKEEDMVGKKACDFYVNPKDRKILEEIVEKNGKIRDFRAHVKRLNGVDFFVEVDAGLIKDDNGKFIGIEGVIRDITEKVKLEQEVEKYKLEERKNSLVKSLSVKTESDIVFK